MDMRAVPIGHGPHKGGSAFTRTPFAISSHASLSGNRLGETEQSLYVRGKAAVAKYDDLTDRLAKLSDKTYRDRVTSRMHGDPEDPEAAVRIRNSVYDSVNKAENSVPIDYLVFSNKPVQDDVAALEDLDRTFEELVKSGEDTYGTVKEKKESSSSLEGPSLGVDTGSMVCAAAGLVIVGTIVYFAFK